MADNLTLESSLERYKVALDLLENFEELEQVFLAEQVLEVLLARQSVQLALEDAKSVSAKTLLSLEAQDNRLKSRRSMILNFKKLSKWRELVNPPKTSWWWYFEPPALLPFLEKPHPLLNQLDWLWKLITLIAVAVSVTFILSTLQRVLAGGLDNTGIFAVMVQTILVLAGGSTLTQQGREALEQTLVWLRIPKYYWQEFSTILAMLFLSIVIWIHSFYLPQLAVNLYQNGVRQYESGHIGSSMSAYQQAIALRPDYVEAHYALGVLYERLQQPDKAIPEYQLVLQSDSKSLNLLTRLRVSNTLGRLYILKGKYNDAWIPLEEGLSLVKESTQTDKNLLYEKYGLLKNLGWLRLQEKYYVDADSFLEEAIALNPERASAHCLRAQLLEGIRREKEALSYWENCIRYAVSSNPDNAKLSATARERLEGRNKP
jgi:tetratricopeptide (TPR) repeat protein